MKVNVKGRHMNLTSALRIHAEEKIGEALMRIFDRPAARVEIELSDLGNVRMGSKECRVTVFMPGHNPITICEFHDDLYSAINLAHDRILEQVKRTQGRRRDSRRIQKWAMRQRARTARQALTATAATEPWEMEVREYEHSRSEVAW